MTDSNGSGRCETDGCHRQTSTVIEYEVYGGGRLRIEERRVCGPCANAMKFRETFAQGTDTWWVQADSASSEKDGGER